MSANPDLEQKIIIALQVWGPNTNWHTDGWCDEAVRIVHEVFQKERDEAYPELGPFPGSTKKKKWIWQRWNSPCLMALLPRRLYVESGRLETHRLRCL